MGSDYQIKHESIFGWHFCPMLILLKLSTIWPKVLLSQDLHAAIFGPEQEGQRAILKCCF